MAVSEEEAHPLPPLRIYEIPGSFISLRRRRSDNEGLVVTYTDELPIPVRIFARNMGNPNFSIWSVTCGVNCGEGMVGWEQGFATTSQQNVVSPPNLKIRKE